MVLSAGTASRQASSAEQTEHYRKEKTDSDTMKTPHVILIIACLVIVGVFGTLTYYYGFHMVERHEIPIDFNVEKGVAGINADASQFPWDHRGWCKSATIRDHPRPSATCHK